MKCELLLNLLLIINYSYLLKLSKSEASITNEIIHQGWLVISSPQFKDISLYSSKNGNTSIPIQMSTVAKYPTGVFRINSKSGIKSFNVPCEYSFYFRLNKFLLFYSETENDYTIIDSMHISVFKEINENSELNQNCFRVSNENIFWDLCANNVDDKKKWICAIRKVLGNPCPEDTPKPANKIYKQPIYIIPIASPYCNQNWNYKGHGMDWLCNCKEGSSQSPIDLPEISKTSELRNATIFQFLENNLYQKGNRLNLVFEDNIIKLKGMLSKIITNNFVYYEMYEMQIHIGSEHSINGKKYDMEIQIYYNAVTPGYIRKNAALGILYKIVPGAMNVFFDKDVEILDLPDKNDKEKKLKANTDLTHLFLSHENDTYHEFSYYKYEGSLTSPPCNEDTTWYIVSEPIPISYTIIESIKDSYRIPSPECNQANEDIEFKYSDLIAETESVILENYREIQCINDREIYHYKSNCKIENKIPEQKGHYEKILDANTRYFYVNDNKPTGIPGAFVVSESEAKSKIQ